MPFCKTQTNHLKGIFAICIVLHHLCNATGIGSAIGLGPIYTALGYWGVSVFLFISGFGLLSQYQRFRGGGYLRNFLRNRVLSLYILNASLAVMYAGFMLILSGTMDTTQFACSFLFGNTIVKFGWYLQACMIFYLFFYAAFRWSTKMTKGITIMLIFLAAYTIGCYLYGMSTTWHECSMTMGAGMIVQTKHEQICSFQNRRRNVLFEVTVFLFVITFILGTRDIIDSDIKIIFKMFSSVFFALCVYFTCFHVRIKNNCILDWLGTHYLEIYVLQGVSILIADKYLNDANPYLYYLFCLTLTLLLATIAKKPIAKLMGAVKKK